MFYFTDKYTKITLGEVVKKMCARNRSFRYNTVGGILISTLAGTLYDHYKAAGYIRVGYGIIFMICATAYLVAWVIMNTLVPKFKKIDLE